MSILACNPGSRPIRLRGLRTQKESLAGGNSPMDDTTHFRSGKALTQRLKKGSHDE
jgi:hypothetical protein